MVMDVIEISSSDSESKGSPSKQCVIERDRVRKPLKTLNSLRHPVYPADVIELTDSSDSEADIPAPSRKPSTTPSKSSTKNLEKLHSPKLKENAPSLPQRTSSDEKALPPVTPRKPSGPQPWLTFVADPTPAALRIFDSTRMIPTAAAPSTPTRGVIPSTPKSSRKPPATPRAGSKKAIAEAAQADRATYATSLFKQLNETVFGSGLPQETTLTWSNRLLSTAGRARWRRGKDGTQTTEIELATKILDSEERIRNTLSHEMCHLACWVINGDTKEGHGKAWKTWASKVMRRRPEIEVSTRHHYEISYPFQWECNNCAKIYGRFSKSIRPDEVLCGACKVGRLEPLFASRARTAPKSPSKKSPSKPQSRGNSQSTVEELLNEIGELGLVDVDDYDDP